jgi:hypothetical protein
VPNGLVVVSYEFFFQWLFQLLRGPGLLFSFVIIFSTDGRTPWKSDQFVARPLPKRRTTQTQYKRIHTPNTHALSPIRTHDPSVRASEDISCHRPRGYCDRPVMNYKVYKASGRCLISVFIPEGLKKTKKDLSQDSKCPGRDSSR